jgi:hypothetical protein
MAEVAVGPGGLSARTLWIVHVGPADCPRAGCGPSARSTELHAVLLGFEENNGPSAYGSWTVRLEAHFSRKLLPKTSDIK